MPKKRIALFGGTFDPVHPGHVAVAAVAAEQIGAEKIIFLPAKCSPLKVLSPAASDDDRLKMIALAIEGYEKFQLSDYELKKDGPCFTLETVREFQAQFGDDTLIYWLLGADGVEDLCRWYRITELIDECNLSVMCRAGFDEPDFTEFIEIWGRNRVEKLQQNIIQTPLIDISSTQIRNKIAAGEDVSEMLNPSVAEYIHEHGLYR